MGITSSTSFYYSFELMRFVYKQEKDGEVSGFLSETQMSHLANILTSQIIAGADGEPLYRFLGEDMRTVLLAWTWYGDRELLRAVITESVEKEGADGAEALIEMSVGKMWDMSNGIPSVSDLRRDAYDFIAQLVEPDLVLRVLRTRYGSELDSPEYRSGPETSTARRLATQFSYLHKQMGETTDKT